MYPHQAERLTSALERGGVDALIATGPANIAYITGFRSATEVPGPAFAVFTREGSALVVSAMEVAGAVADSIPVDHIACFGDLPAAFGDRPRDDARRIQTIAERRAADPVAALASALIALDIGAGSVGLDESGLAHGDWLRVQDGLAAGKVVAVAEHLHEARRVKAPYEIECLGQALHIAEGALDAVIQTIDRGMTEREAATLYASEVLKREAWPRSPRVAIGSRTAVPAASPSDRALGASDLVRFDVACEYKGYCARVARTAVLGVPNPRLEAAHAAIQAGLEAAVAAARAGALALDVPGAAVAAVRAAGLSAYECAEVGHGVGLEPVERPALRAGGRAALEMGEVLQLELPYYEIGTMGVCLTTTVLVTSDGARALNRSYASLIALD
jgi:Xaa-Pro aminopeptidase